MKIKAVVFAVVLTEIKEGPDNGWKWWFKDPSRNILLFQMAGTLRPQNAPIDNSPKDDFILYHKDLLSYLKNKGIEPHEVVFISDMYESLIFAKKSGFNAVEVQTGGRKIKAGGFDSCQPNGDSITMKINYFERPVYAEEN